MDIIAFLILIWILWKRPMSDLITYLVVLWMLFEASYR